MQRLIAATASNNDCRVSNSSVIVAVLFGEPDASIYIEALSLPERKLMSAVTRLESAIVLESRKGLAGGVA